MVPIAVIVMFCISLSLTEKCPPDPYYDYKKYGDFEKSDKKVIRQHLGKDFTKGDLFLQFQLDLDPDWIGTKISVPTVVFPRDADKEPFFYIYYPSKSGTSEQFDKMSAAEFIDFLYQC
uniref:Secreted protein n=1 Tax=Haemonchus contortus TaxID=6289 RepID=A0A7I4YJ29_HAECO